MPPDDEEPATLTLEELAERAGEARECLAEWRALGLLGSTDGSTFTLLDVARARLIRFCLGSGVHLDTIVRAEAAEPGFLDHYLEQLFPAGPQRTYSIDEAAAQVPLELATARRLHHVSGTPWLGQRIVKEDIEVLRGWKAALEQGLPEDALFQLVRVYADSLGRIAEAEARLFHFYAHERMREAGLSGQALREQTKRASEAMRRLIEPALLYFHRKGMAAAICEDALLHLAQHSDAPDRRDVPAQLRLAIAFLDLASFTSMTESMGDAAAAEVVSRFSELVRDVVVSHHGRLVEQIGDAFMLVFPEAGAAVSCLLGIGERAAQEDRFPALRGGIHIGPVLYREGGYVGTNVNIASRIASEARRHQLLVSAEVRRDVSLPGIDFVPLGKRALKGLSDELELFEARLRSDARGTRMTDPVCGMELTEIGVAARLSLEGRDVAFCSETCLRRYLEGRR